MVDAKSASAKPSSAAPAGANGGGAYKYVKVDDRFGRLARSSGGLSRLAAMQRAEAELEHAAPGVAQYIRIECKRLETTLLAARAQDENLPQFIAEAYLTSQHLRDVAGSVGFSLIGFIATNLCTIFETMEAAHIDFPAAVMDCHLDALRLAQSRDYEGKELADVPELSAGLIKTVQMVKNAARAVAPAAKPSPAAVKN
jgi:hypothetical protein